MLTAFKKKVSKYFAPALSALGVLLLGILFIMKPAQTAAGVSAGLKLSAGTVIPSLFPFLVLGSFAVNSGAAEALGRLFSLPVRKIFKLPGCAASVIFMGLLGGYPIGASMTAQLHKSGRLGENEAQRLIMFCVNPGPAFVISAVGCTMLGSFSAGLILFFSLCLSSLTVGFILRFFAEKNEISPSPPSAEKASLSRAFVLSVSDGASASLSIAAWVTLFECFSFLLSAAALSESTLLPLKCLLEVTGGCAASAGKINLPAVAAVLGWSGLSVQCQLLTHIRACSMRPLLFITSRAICGGVAAIFCRLLLIAIPIYTEAFTATATGLPAEIFSVSPPAAAGLMMMCGLLLLTVQSEEKDVATRHKI